MLVFIFGHFGGFWRCTHRNLLPLLFDKIWGFLHLLHQPAAGGEFFLVACRSWWQPALRPLRLLREILIGFDVFLSVPTRTVTRVRARACVHADAGEHASENSAYFELFVTPMAPCHNKSSSNIPKCTISLKKSSPAAGRDLHMQNARFSLCSLQILFIVFAFPDHC